MGGNLSATIKLDAKIGHMRVGWRHQASFPPSTRTLDLFRAQTRHQVPLAAVARRRKHGNCWFDLHDDEIRTNGTRVIPFGELR
jgi:hypothetical protein